MSNFHKSFKTFSKFTNTIKMSIIIWVGCFVIMQAIVRTQQQGFPEINFENTPENIAAWLELEEKLNHQIAPKGLIQLVVLMGNAKVAIKNGVWPNATEILGSLTEDITTLQNRRSILDVAVMADKDIQVPKVEDLPEILRTSDEILTKSKNLKPQQALVYDALTRLLNFYECQLDQINLPDTAFGLMVLKEIDNKHGKYLQNRYPIENWIQGVCERSKRHGIVQGDFCHDLARQWKNRSGKTKKEQRDYWINSSVLQNQLNRTNNKVFEKVGREHEGMWGKLNVECQLALVSRCEIPYACERTLLDPTPRSQYLLTHQVLQRVFVENVECPDSPVVTSFVTEENTYTELCAKMYMEAKYLDALNFPVVHRDLFIELVGFCGYLGYTNFFWEDWLQAILSWQSKTDLGCFIKSANSPVGIVSPDIPIKKLENCDKEEKGVGSKEKCLPHFTAVGLIALAVHWDYLSDLEYELGDE